MRGKKRKRQSIWPKLAAVAVLALALWLLLTNVVFVIRNVLIDGAGEIPPEDVLRLSGIRLGSPMSQLNENEVRLAVESDGRLAFVGLEKRYPNGLLLKVRLRSHDAVVLQGGKVLVLDSDGYVAQVADHMPEEQIPYVSGLRASYNLLGRQVDTADGRCAAMSAILKALKDRGAMQYASEISVEDIEDLRIISRTGITVLLGLQTFVIIGGVVKLIPLTGVTMPFVSYGGTSLISSLCLIGLLQGVASLNEDNLREDMRLATLG